MSVLQWDFGDLLRLQSETGDNQLWLISKNNSHLSEHTAPADNDILLLTGFKGISARLTVTRQESLLWVDGRYRALAQRQFEGSPVACRSKGGTDSLSEYLDSFFAGKKKIPAPEVMLDPFKWSSLEIESYRRRFPHVKWIYRGIFRKPERIEKPRRISFVPPRLSGMETAEKLALLRSSIRPGHIHLLVNPEDIAWLLNLRSRDFPFSRGMRGKLLLSERSAVLFSDLSGSDILRLRRSHPGWTIVPSERQWLPVLRDVMGKAGRATLCVEHNQRPGAVSIGIMEKLRSVCGPGRMIEMDRSHAEIHRMRKNSAEISALRRAGRRMGTIMRETVSWLQKRIDSGASVTEQDLGLAADGIASSRGAVARAFQGMTSSGENTAIPHHKRQDGKRILAGEMVVIDIGYYFEDDAFASDLSRTILAGSGSSATTLQKTVYTTVLRAFLKQLCVRFRPGELKASQLDEMGRDILCRAKEKGFAVLHGSGHGIGINTHELGLTISPDSDISLRAGFCYCIEPGLYSVSERRTETTPEVFGVRLEDTVTLREDCGFLEHESLNRAPFDSRLIAPALLAEDDAARLRAYEALC